MNSFITADETISIETVVNNPSIALISDKICSFGELNQAFRSYMKLSRKDRRFSDYYSVQLYGCTVPEMYFVMREQYKAEIRDSLPFTTRDTLFVSEPDLYYNKMAFDEGKINMCFVIGYSGSGKSVLTKEYSGTDIERIELDDIVCVKDHYSLEGLKQNSDMMYSFFAGSGSKYYISRQERSLFADHAEVFVDFIDYACKYAKDHPNKRYILEGIWTYLFFGDPTRFDEYAVFIKGTSLMKSKLRRIKREMMNNAEVTVNRIKEFGIYMTDSMLYDSNVDKWRHHFELRAKTELIYEENKFRVLHERIMHQIYAINSYFVHNDKNGIESIVQSLENTGDADPGEKRVVLDECRKALADLR